MLSLEGQQLGNYDVIRRIRVGGMGAVYEGRQRTAFDRRVAIKVILGDYASDRDMRRRFAREARTVARLHHPHILPLIEFGDERGILYLVMPFIDGGTLTTYLRRSLPGLDEVSSIYQQLLDAVEYAHDEGLIHRDIKSSNVLFEERRSGQPYIYLADFGLVRTRKQTENSQAGKPIPLDQVPGTPHYMAPEQTRGIVTPLTDIYALGVLLYQMLTGELPYNDPDDIRVIEMHLHDPIPSPCDHDASIPRELGSVVRKAMAKRPEARYRNVAELRNAFLSAVKGPEIQENGDNSNNGILIEEETYIPPRKRVPTPLTLHEPSGSPEPLVLSKSVQPSARNAQIPVAAKAARLRNTDTVKPRRRITEEPTVLNRKHKQVNFWLIATISVSLVLLALLIMPRVLGFSLFPSGFPVLGSSPVATVYITVQSKVVQDKYVLTASPQVKQADLVTHTIPDRVLQSDANNASSVQTTGTKTIGGMQAHGVITFTNASDNPVPVPTSLTLATASGVKVQVTQGVTIPPHQEGQDGTTTAPAIAINPGAAGNIAALSIDGACCTTGNAVTAKNIAAFTGGTDAQTTHIVNQSDLDGVQNALAPKLQGQVQQQLQKMLQKSEVMVGQPTYSIAVSSSDPVGAQTDHVQVTIKVSGSITAYDRALATRTAIQLLRTHAIQTLDSNYQAQGDPSASPPTAAAGQGGVIYISISVHGLWVFALAPQQVDQWRQSIRGASSAAALAYLNTQPGIAAVQVNLPFGTDHLPTSISGIKIITISH